MSQNYDGVYWLNGCVPPSGVAPIWSEWDILMTRQFLPIALRVIRPVIAGLITLGLLQAIMPDEAPERLGSVTKLVHIPAA